MYHFAPTKNPKSEIIYIQQITTCHFSKTSGIPARFGIYAFRKWRKIFVNKEKSPSKLTGFSLCGTDGTRTRDPLRDRQVF